MGNSISSFFSGFFKAISNLFESPLDFVSGKSCSSVCGSTWDFICYLENFCVANLLKMAMVLVLSYIVLLFFYLLYKLGICGCIGHSLCRISWACLVSWFSFWEYCCTFLWVKLTKLKRINRRMNIEEEFDSGEEEYYDESFSCDTPRGRSLSHRREIDYRGIHLRKSLRPRSHHVRVGIYTDSIHGHRRKPRKHHNPSSTVHDIRVTHTSKFVKKGTNSRGRAIYRSTSSTNTSPI